MRNIYESPCMELLSIGVIGMIAASAPQDQEARLEIGSDKVDPNDSWAKEFRDWDNIW